MDDERLIGRRLPKRCFQLRVERKRVRPPEGRENAHGKIRMGQVLMERIVMTDRCDTAQEIGIAPHHSRLVFGICLYRLMTAE